MTTALITGASAGLGTEFARLFAADHHDLILTARRLDRLDSLAADLEREHNVKVHVIACDLGAAGGAAQIIEKVTGAGAPVDFLVNNAGFGSAGSFAELDPARELAMVQLNITALVELTRAFLPGMVARGSGRILNLGSTAGFQPGPYMATYYATKAFVNSFTEALWYELKGTGVSATVSCPGATATEFSEAAGNHASRLGRLGKASAVEVAREAYDAMHAGKPLIVHGFKNKFGAFAVRLSPRAMVRAIAGRLNRSPEAPALPEA